MGDSSHYVVAREIKQVGSSVPKPNVADVWLGSSLQQTDDGKPFFTLEIKPAWGLQAQIRLSHDELHKLGAMIADRLDPDGTAIAGAQVELSVSEGTQVKISYT